MSSEYDEYAANMNGETPTSTATSGVPADTYPPAQPTHPVISDSRVKMEHAARLLSSMVLHFNEVKAITRNSHYEGALLLDISAANGMNVELWIPKKLCSNLDLAGKTICIWDKFFADKIKELDELGGLACPAEYFKREDLGIEEGEG